jgi:uncharacterized protein
MAGMGMCPSALLAGRTIFVYTYLYRRCMCGLIGMRLRAAATMFDDPDFVMSQDREVDGEERWHTVGLVEGVLLLLVAHTIQDEHGEEIVRIISAREATARERRRYEDGQG